MTSQAPPYWKLAKRGCAPPSWILQNSAEFWLASFSSPQQQWWGWAPQSLGSCPGALGSLSVGVCTQELKLILHSRREILGVVLMSPHYPGFRIFLTQNKKVVLFYIRPRCNYHDLPWQNDAHLIIVLQQMPDTEGNHNYIQHIYRKFAKDPQGINNQSIHCNYPESCHPKLLNNQNTRLVHPILPFCSWRIIHALYSFPPYQLLSILVAPFVL